MSAKEFFELVHGPEENLNKQHVITLLDQYHNHKVLDKMKIHDINNNMEETRKVKTLS